MFRRGLERLLLPTGLLIGLLLFGYVAAAPVTAGRTGADTAAAVQPGEQILNGDLVVESGEVLDDDVVVYNGNATVKADAAIRGSLVVYSGDVEIETNGMVNGDVAAFSGDVVIDGTVGGSIAAWSGSVSLDENASVGGDISILGGEVEIEEGASVGGNVLSGPSFNFAAPSTVPFGFRFSPEDFPLPNSAAQSKSLTSIVAGFFLRLLGAIGTSVLVTLLVGVVMVIRPEFVVNARLVAGQQTALSFVVGLLANLMLAFIGALLVITICLSPLAVVPLLLLIVLNVVGWATVSLVAGRYLTGLLNLPMQTVVQTLLGAFVLLIITAPLVALGGCFRLAAMLTLLLLTSVGVGAIILPWLDRGRHSGEEVAAVALPLLPAADPTGPDDPAP